MKKLLCKILGHNLFDSIYIDNPVNGQRFIICNRCKYYVPMYELD